MSERKPITTAKHSPAPQYWDRACRELTERDPVLAQLIESHRDDTLRGSGNAFRTLINAIVGQQISVAAAGGIWKRLVAAFPGLSSDALAGADTGELRAAGLSWRKAEYIKGIAQAFSAGRIDDTAWHEWGDDEIREQLTGLRGIGRWTADMVLIFHMQRPDVLPLGDIGLINAAADLYGWSIGSATSTAARLRALRERVSTQAERWRPWRTVATWYIWRDLDAEPVIY
ncbi:MAG: DNA-3-methyladenine glycosylase family protein [bacterium]